MAKVWSEDDQDDDSRSPERERPPHDDDASRSAEVWLEFAKLGDHFMVNLKDAGFRDGLGWLFDKARGNKTTNPRPRANGAATVVEERPQASEPPTQEEATGMKPAGKTQIVFDMEKLFDKMIEALQPVIAFKGHRKISELQSMAEENRDIVIREFRRMLQDCMEIRQGGQPSEDSA